MKKSSSHPPQIIVSPGAAVVDDFLARRHDVGSSVSQWVHDLCALEAPLPAQMKSVARRIGDLGEDGIEALARLLEEPDASQMNVIMELLVALDPAKSKPVLDRLINAPSTAEDLRLLLGSIAIFQDDEQAVEPPIAGLGPESFASQTLNVLFKRFDWEESALTWMTFRKEMNEDARQFALTALLDEKNPLAMPVFRMEALTANVETTRLLAKELGGVTSRQALAVLELLQDNDDLVTRLNASESIAKCRNRLRAQYKKSSAANVIGAPGAAEDEESALSPGPPPGKFLFTEVFLNPPAGEAAFLTARLMEGKAIKCLSGLIDCWDRGLFDTWGCSLDPKGEGLEAARKDMSGVTGAEPRSLNENDTAYLIRESVRLSRERDYQPPDEFFIWEHLLIYPYHRPADGLGLKFGWNCAVCSEPIRTGGRRAVPLVFSGALICPKCSHRKPGCARCGDKVNIAQSYLNIEEDGTASFLCRKCFDQLSGGQM
ncbi:MAG: hypothetical protein NTX50_09770 [Candidatus Sumerlaeota bacterium]|nr:hypothetical protein [Candidatus Sumerlaeota bacterium]